MTQYTVTRYSKNFVETCGARGFFHVYSIRSSNRAAINKYRDEVKKRFPDMIVRVITVEEERDLIARCKAMSALRDRVKINEFKLNLID